MRDLSVIRTIKMSMYLCEGEDCRAIYAVEEDKTEEPLCSACGCQYFSHITDKQVQIR